MSTWAHVVEVIAAGCRVTRVTDEGLKANFDYEDGTSHFATVYVWEAQQDLLIFDSPVVRKDRPGASGRQLAEWLVAQGLPLGVSDFGGEWLGFRSFVPLAAVDLVDVPWFIGQVAWAANEAERQWHDGIDVYTSDPAPTAVLSAGEVRFCGQCGQSRPTGARFCGGCGAAF